jgi:hypothetical protein
MKMVHCNTMVRRFRRQIGSALTALTGPPYPAGLFGDQAGHWEATEPKVQLVEDINRTRLDQVTYITLLMASTATATPILSATPSVH